MLITELEYTSLRKSRLWI